MKVCLDCCELSCWCVLYVVVDFPESKCDSSWRWCQCHDSDHVCSVFLLLNTPFLLSRSRVGCSDKLFTFTWYSVLIPSLCQYWQPALSSSERDVAWMAGSLRCSGFPHPSAAQRGIPGMRQWHWSWAAQRHIPPRPLSSAVLMILAGE